VPVILHPQLQKDCFRLGTVESSALLLHKNALVPWFILVPETDEDELFKLDYDHQLSVLDEINKIADFTQHHFIAHKLNIASIGNIVPQLHIHIIARFKDDFCWPKPVWGQTESKEYTNDELHSLTQVLSEQQLI